MILISQCSCKYIPFTMFSSIQSEYLFPFEWYRKKKQIINENSTIRWKKEIQPCYHIHNGGYHEFPNKKDICVEKQN